MPGRHSGKQATTADVRVRGREGRPRQPQYAFVGLHERSSFLDCLFHEDVVRIVPTGPYRWVNESTVPPHKQRVRRKCDECSETFVAVPDARPTDRDGFTLPDDGAKGDGQP